MECATSAENSPRNAAQKNDGKLRESHSKHHHPKCSWKYRDVRHSCIITRLNMLFTPTLPGKAIVEALLSNANDKQC